MLKCKDDNVKSKLADFNWDLQEITSVFKDHDGTITDANIYYFYATINGVNYRIDAEGDMEVD